MVKNPYGRRGSPAHRHRIGQVEQKLTSNGWQTVAGGDLLPERKYGNYFPDLVMEKGSSRIAIQVGKATRSGLPVARERRCLKGLKTTGQFTHVFFLKYLVEPNH